MPQAVRMEASVRWEPRSLAMSVEDLHEMALLERTVPRIDEQVVLRGLQLPSSQVLAARPYGCWGDEDHAVLSTFPSTDKQRSQAGIPVLNQEPENFARPESGVSHHQDKASVTTSDEGLGTDLQHRSDLIFGRDLRQSLRRPHGQPGHQVWWEGSDGCAPTEKVFTVR
jgi:hypothetical protein